MVSTNCFASIVSIGSFDPKFMSNIERKALKFRYFDSYLHQLRPEFSIVYLLLWCQPRFRGHSWWTDRARCQFLSSYQWFPAQAFVCKSPFLLKFARAHLTILVTASFQLETLPFCHVKIICSLGSACDSWYCYSTFQSNLLALVYLQSVYIVLNYFSAKHLLTNYFHGSTALLVFTIFKTPAWQIAILGFHFR